MKKNKCSRTINKDTFSIIFILLGIPTIIWFFLKLAEIIHTKYPDLDINPPGISYNEWLIFFGVYLGAIASVYAVYYSVNKNMEYNRNKADCEKNIENLRLEKEKVSKVIQNLDLFLLPNYWNISQCIKFNNGIYDEDFLKEELVKVNDFQNVIHKDSVMLSIETSIYHSCESFDCNKKDECILNISRNEFNDSYKECYDFVQKMITSIKQDIDKKNANNLRTRIILEEIKSERYNDMDAEFDKYKVSEDIEKYIKEAETKFRTPRDKMINACVNYYYAMEEKQKEILK